MDIKPIKISALNERLTGTSETWNTCRTEDIILSTDEDIIRSRRSCEDY